jgi:hypothetical protein
MDHLFVSEETADLLVIVERLSTQDQRRIVRLIHLLAQAPDALRQQAQRMLRDLIAREPETRADCLGEIDRIIARVEYTLELETLTTSPPGGPRAVADRSR